MVRVLPNAGEQPEMHWRPRELPYGLVASGMAPRSSARLIVSGARSQSRGQLPAPVQGAEKRQFRIPPQVPVANPSAAPQFHPVFPHGLPAGHPGAALPQVVFNAIHRNRTAQHAQQQYLFPPQHPPPAANPNREQRRTPHQPPPEQQQQQQLQQPRNPKQTHVLKGTQQSLDSLGCPRNEPGHVRPRIGKETLQTLPLVQQQPDMHAKTNTPAQAGHELQGCPRAVVPGPVESSTLQQQPAPVRLSPCFEHEHEHPAPSASSEGRRTDNGRVMSRCSLEREGEGEGKRRCDVDDASAARTGGHENVHLWAAPEDGTATGLDVLPKRSVPAAWARASTGGALLRNAETERRAKRLSPIRTGQQKAAALRSASAQPVPSRPSSKEDSDCQLLHEEHIFSPKARQNSTQSTVEPSVRDAQESSRGSSSRPSASADADDKPLASGDEAQHVTEAAPETKEESHGLQASSEATGSHRALEEDLDEPDGQDGDAANDSTSNEQSLEEERYVKVLVPGYLNWQQKQLEEMNEKGRDGEVEIVAQTEACLWASDLIIETSRKGMGREIIVNTKQCRAERPLLNTCLERLGWTRDDQTSNKGGEGNCIAAAHNEQTLLVSS